MNNVIVRRSRLGDINILAKCLRNSDIDEIWASHHIKPYSALYDGWKKSVLCLTVVYKDVPVAMFGIHADDLIGRKATVWFLASDGLDEMRVSFIKQSKKFINMMLGFYPYLENYVDARNIKSIQWLRFCGAKIEEASKFGKEELPFHYFYFQRD